MRAAERQRLPNRRLATTRHIEHADPADPSGAVFRAEVTIGRAVMVDPNGVRLGRPQEVFVETGKPGTRYRLELDDVAVILSVALQHGVPPEAFRKSIARQPAGGSLTETTDAPASLTGAVVDVLCEEAVG